MVNLSAGIAVFLIIGIDSCVLFSMNRKKIGDRAEILVANYLESLGWQIIQRNFRFHHKEIDLIAREEDSLVFIEVKYRPQLALVNALEAISTQKKRHISYVARYFLQKEAFWQEYCEEIRFDVAGVDEKGKIHYLKAAFFL